MTELPPQIRDDLARLRALEGPPDGAEDRVLGMLHASLGPGGGGPTGDGGNAAPAPASAATASVGVKGTAIAVALAGAGLVAVKLVVSAVAPSASPETAAQVDPATATVVDANPDPAARPAPRQSDGAGPAASPSPPPPSEREPVVERDHRDAAPAPAKNVATPAADKPQTPRANEDPLAAELTALRVARATKDARARLRLLREHRTRFGKGVLATERDALIVATLCELGRTDEARPLAAQLLSSAAGSPLRTRVRSTCPDLEIP